MPSLSIDKYVFTKRVNEGELRFGDLVFANTCDGTIRKESVEFLRGTLVPEGVDHVALYVGNGEVLHATKVKGMVVKESLEELKNGRMVTGNGRVLDNLDEERYVVRVPSVRLDIRIKEDLAEEIGRIIGYDKLTPVLPKLTRSGLSHKRMYYENKVREILLENDFSEVMTYTFGNSGVVELKKGLADDKEKLRSSLELGMREALAKNIYNAPLLGQKVVRIFEFGNIFTENTERRNLALTLDDGAKKSNYADQGDFIIAGIKRALGGVQIDYKVVSSKPYIVEIDFDALIDTLKEPSIYEAPSFAN